MEFFYICGFNHSIFCHNAVLLTPNTLQSNRCYGEQSLN